MKTTETCLPTSYILSPKTKSPYAMSQGHRLPLWPCFSTTDVQRETVKDANEQPWQYTLEKIKQTDKTPRPPKHTCPPSHYLSPETKSPYATQGQRLPSWPMLSPTDTRRKTKSSTTCSRSSCSELRHFVSQKIEG